MRPLLALVAICACEHGRSPKTLQCGARTAVEHRIPAMLGELDATAFMVYRSSSPPAIVVATPTAERVGGGYRPPVDGFGKPGCWQLGDSFTAEVDGIAGVPDDGGWMCSAGPIEEPLCDFINVRFDLAGAPEPQGVITLHDDTGTLALEIPPL